MASKSKKSGSEPKKSVVPVPRRATASGGERVRRRRAGENVFPTLGVLFNRRGELVVVDPNLAAKLAEKLADGEMTIRSMIGPIIKPPPPPPNALCGCAGFRIRVLERIPRRTRAPR